MTRTGYTNSLKFLLMMFILHYIRVTGVTDVNTASETVYMHEITQF